MRRRAKTTTTIGLVLLAATVALGACNQQPEEQDDTDPCAEGQWIKTQSAGRVCVVKEKIVIETGFQCPASAPTRQAIGEHVVCSDGKLGPEGRRDVNEKLEDRPSDVGMPDTTRPETGGGDSGTADTGPADTSMPDGGGNPSATTKLDLLWVVDNSQSMCQEQKQLRDNFPEFIDTLVESPVDFNVAVTTTHMAENSAFEKVAKPGHIQATPSPVTGFDPTCRFKVDASGEAIDHDYNQSGTQGPDYTPVKNQVAQAVECTKNPQKWQGLKNPRRATIECALFGNNPKVDPQACDKAGKDPREFRTEDLFPPQSAYRDIPKVLRAEDYRNGDGSLNRQALQEDFACMSFVGTRGASSEQGLRAATRAVSPEMTGGTVKTGFANPADRRQHIETQREDHPNYGLLRKDAKFGVIFVTDENDCSHTGNIIQKQSRQNACDEANCYFPTSEAVGDQDPLLSTKKLSEDFMKNLAASKGVDSIDPDDVFVASIHGKYRRYSGPEPQMCQQGKRYVTPTCASPLGKAKSGDRYEDFLRNFEHYFPKPPAGNPGQHLQAYMCIGTLKPALQGIASFLNR